MPDLKKHPVDVGVCGNIPLVLCQIALPRYLSIQGPTTWLKYRSDWDLALVISSSLLYTLAHLAEIVALTTGTTHTFFAMIILFVAFVFIIIIKGVLSLKAKGLTTTATTPDNPTEGWKVNDKPNMNR